MKKPITGQWNAVTVYGKDQSLCYVQVTISHVHLIGISKKANNKCFLDK